MYEELPSNVAIAENTDDPYGDIQFEDSSEEEEEKWELNQ